jgi:hypothetical protein
VRHLARIGEMRNAYNMLVGKPEVKRPLGRSRCGLGIILKWILAGSASGPRTPLECTRDYGTAARCAADTRVRGGANLNCTFQLTANCSQPCTAYQQLKFCEQSLLDGLCK